MEQISQWLADHRRWERGFYALLLVGWAEITFLNVRMAWAILPCQTTADFLSLLDHPWVAQAWMGRTVFQFMQYYYTEASPLFLFFSALSPVEIAVFFGSAVELLLISSDIQMRSRQRRLFQIVLLHGMALAALLICLFQALFSLTTGAAFQHLRTGAFFFNVGNSCSFFYLLIAGIQLLRRQ